MDDTSSQMTGDSREGKSNIEALEKYARPARKVNRLLRNSLRQPPRLQRGRGRERPGSSGRSCHRQLPAALTIDHRGTPQHRGQFLVRILGFAWFQPLRLICATFLCCAVLTFTTVAAQQQDAFPHGVPVRMIESEEAVARADPALTKPTDESTTVATKAEAGLQSEAEEIKEQARRSWTPGENLLTPSSSADTS